MDTLQEDACATAEQRSRIYGKIQGSPPQRIDGDGAWLEQTTATDRTAGYSAAVASSPGCVRSYDTRCCKICRVRCEPVRGTRQSNQARFAAKHHRNSSVPAHLNTRRHAEGRPVSPVAIAGPEASATRFGCPRPKPGSETRKKSRLSLLRACAAPEMPRTARARGLRTWLRKTAVAAGFGRVAARPESAPLRLPGWEHARQSAVAGPGSFIAVDGEPAAPHYRTDAGIVDRTCPYGEDHRRLAYSARTVIRSQPDTAGD